MLRARKYTLFIYALISCSFFTVTTLNVYAKGDRINVVATQRIFADLVKQIGQKKVSVKSIASPKFNIHNIQPKPSDVRNVARADLYVSAGLDAEPWSDPLLEAAGNAELFRGRRGHVDLSQGIELRKIPQRVLSRSEGDIHLYGNVHYHMNPENMRIMAQSIRDKLIGIDQANALEYEKNTDEFITKLNKKIVDWKILCAHCRGREIISYHDDIEYFAHFLGMKAEQFLESKPGVTPTAKHLIFLGQYVESHDVAATLMPTYFSRNAAEKLNRKISLPIVTICQGVGEIPGTDSVFEFFDYNFKQISEGIK